MSKRPALVRRLPRLFGAPPSEPIVSVDARSEYAELEPDFGFLDRELVPSFEQHDEAALRAQNRFRRQQLWLILGGAATTILGGIHASLGSGWEWVAITEAVVAALLTGIVLVAQHTRSQQAYLKSRLRAEKLRAEFFLYVARVGVYADDAHRQGELNQRVGELTADEDG